MAAAAATAESKSEVQTWLESSSKKLDPNDVKLLADAFHKEKIRTVRDLGLLTREDFGTMKIPIGTRNRFLATLKRLPAPSQSDTDTSDYDAPSTPPVIVRPVKGKVPPAPIHH